MLSSLLFGEMQQYVLQSEIYKLKSYLFSQKHFSYVGGSANVGGNANVGCNAKNYNSAKNESESVFGFIPDNKRIRDWLLPMY